MTNKSCKACTSKLRERLDQEIRSGTGLSEFVAWCADRGLEITLTELKRHAEKHVREVSVDQVEVSQVEVMDIANFENFCQSVGLSLEDFRDLDQNIEKIIFASQRAITLLFFKNAALANHRMDAALSDDALYPVDEVRGLRLVHEMYCGITGLKMRVDENLAIKLLEARGFEISRKQLNE